MKRWIKRGISSLLVMLMIITMMLSGKSMIIAKADGDAAGAVSVKLNAEQTESLEAGGIHRIGVEATNETSSVATLKLFLKNQDNSAAMDIAVPNLLTKEEITDNETQKTLEETLSQAVTCADGSQLALDAQWKQETDGNGNVTARYLQAALPAGAYVKFDMELQYELSDGTTGAYEKKVNVEGNAYIDEADVTEAVLNGNADNTETVSWSGEAGVTEISEAMDEPVMLASSGTAVAGNIYFAVPTDWTTKNYTIKIYVQQGDSGEGVNKTYLEEMTDTRDTTLDGRKIYKYSYSEDQCLYGGYAKLYFQAFNSDTWVTQYTPINGTWTSASVFNGKLYDPNTSTWVEYTPFDPDNHTTFAGKMMYFESKGSTDVSGGITAVFYEKDTNGNLQEVKRIAMAAVNEKRFSVTIPDSACSYVRFVNASGEVLGDTYSNFYGQGEGEEGVESFIYDEASMYCYRYVSTASDSSWGALGGITVYFDATLSKLQYVSQDAPDNRIPSGDTISCHIWSSTDSTKSKDIQMTKVNDYTENENTWSDVYKVEIPERYNKILFYDGTTIPNTDTPKKTVDLTIPTNLNRPCFYADSSDDVIYSTKNRDGYWDEVYTIRDPEKESTDKNTTVVDVASGNLVKQNNQLYVSTTLYDYYTDYELNGVNRDNYDATATVTSHRIYQPFRQFDQALSEYYKKNQANSPLYWGNFQNYSGSHFNEIKGTLNLFGSGDANKFFYENNSMWGCNGVELSYAGANATQGLVESNLSNGNLQIKTAGGTALAPFFDQSFLEGNNAKNTVLGKVYKDVSFPFVKKAIDSGSGTVDYWYFDSADGTAENKNLQLQYSETDGYFLQSTDQVVNGETAENGGTATTKGNYFPFNTSSQSGNAAQLNYGFGQKIEIDFRLTKDGTVKNSVSEDVPIEFNFSGDDDVWVFIDDELVLDVGGGHAVVTGTINFQNKTATVSKVKNSSGGGATDNVEYEFGNLFGEDFYSTGHTLTMFYMERGLWESNMKITFNFPDENKFWVEKQVETPNVNSLFTDAVSTLSNSTFEFDIQNLATHETELAASSTTKTKTYNNTFATSKVSKYGSKVTDLGPGDTSKGKTSVRWKASGYRNETDSQDNTENRLISIYPSDGSEFQPKDGGDSLIDYMTFDIYNDYDGNSTENGSSPFVALVDSNNHKIGAWAGDVGYKGASNRTGKQTWNTISVDLTALKTKSVYGTTEFDFTKIKEVRIGYWNNSTMYVSNIQFHKAATIQQLTGFTTAQKDIPSYGSVTSRTLMPATGAQYSLKTTGTAGTSKEVVNNGTLYLKDEQTATFADQFRRGSYIYLSEKNIDSNVFDTKYTIYDNNVAVSSDKLGQTTSTTGLKGTAVGSVIDVSGFTVNDGRKELNPQDSTIVVPENSILFRSYSNPDNTAIAMNVGVKYVNTLKTGSLTITKAQVGNVFETGENFKFRIIFSNVAGMNLEDNVEANSDIIEEFTLAVGETKSFENIPAGTNYILEEVLEEDSDVSVNSITTSGGNDNFTQLSSNKVTGIIVADSENDFDTITFTNTKNPTVEIQGEKLWKNADETELTDNLPEYIVLKVQSKIKGTSDDTYKDVYKLDDSGTATGEVLTVQVSADDNWKFNIENLPKYENYNISNGTHGEEFVYRVVEIKIKFAGQETLTDIVSGSGGGYQVSYDESGNVINTLMPESKIKITKVDATNENTKLANVEFKLEKLGDDTTWSEISTKATGDGNNGSEEGVLYFENLENGTYRLTETKAADGYSLLKEPVTIVIERPNGFKINDESHPETDVTNDTIGITISNRAKFDLPATGGYGRYMVILGGLALAGLGLLMYRLQKRRKGGLNPGWR